MNKPKVVNGFVGYIKQFVHMDMNNLKPDMVKTATSVSYFDKDKRLISRKNKIINNYINRDVSSGRTPGTLNIEEIATLWHFPVEAVVKAPLIQKTPGRKAEAPMTLPIAEGTIAGPERIELSDKENIFAEPVEEEKKIIIKPQQEIGRNTDAPPDNLPTI